MGAPLTVSGCGAGAVGAALSVDVGEPVSGLADPAGAGVDTGVDLAPEPLPGEPHPVIKAVAANVADTQGAQRPRLGAPTTAR